MQKILIVDDVAINRALLHALFENEFEVLEAENGEVALDIVRLHSDSIAIVLLDILMPVIDGFGVLEGMQKQGFMQHIPVILITGSNDEAQTLAAYQLGVADMISKPFNADIVYRRVKNVIALYAHSRNLEEKLREQKIMLERQAARLRQTNQFVIDALSTTVEFRNVESGEHIKRMRTLTQALLEKARVYYPLTDEEIEAMSSASALHDIGKIAIPDAILLKPGRLTTEEFEIMKTHTLRGCEILESINQIQDEAFYRYCYDICRHHHERYDGRGYPDGLKGDEISIWAQATSLADVYDALTSKRVYKDAYPHDVAVNMILNNEAGSFNPRLLECFLSVQHTLHNSISDANQM